MMIPVVKSLADNAILDLPLQPLVWALALGACLGMDFSITGQGTPMIFVI